MCQKLSFRDLHLVSGGLADHGCIYLRSKTSSQSRFVRLDRFGDFCHARRVLQDSHQVMAKAIYEPPAAFMSNVWMR